MSSSMSSSKQMSSFQSSQTSSFSSAQKIIPNVFIHVIIETNVIFPIFSDLLIFLSPKNHPKCLHPCHHRNKCHLSNLLRPPHFPQPKSHPFLHHNHLAYKLPKPLKLSQGWEVLKTLNLRKVRTEQVCQLYSRTLIIEDDGFCF